MKRGFTITELLVTIAVIVAVGGIAYPVYAGIRERAQSAVCLNQLRGLGVSMESYLVEHGEFFPSIEMGREKSNGTSNVMEEELLPYVGGPEAFHCPADHEEFANSGSSYFWNHHASGMKRNRVMMMGMAAGSSKIPLIHDKEAFHGDDDGTNFLFIDLSAGKDLDFEVESE